MTYTYKVDFFAEIDTELKAYLLGVFYSRGTGRIQVGAADFFILELIKSSLSYSGPIRTYGDSAEIHISSRPFLAQLISLGCVKSKQSDSFFPIHLGHLLPSFIGGVFDSYGQVVIVKGKYLNVCLTYNELFIQGLRTYLKDYLGVSTKHTYTSLSTNTIKMMITNSCDAKKFLSYVYAERFSCEGRNRLKYQEYLQKGV
jgi:hypothetical protein